MKQPAVLPAASLADRLFALMLTLLPHHLLSRLMHAVTRCRWAPLKNRLIRWAIGHYGIDMNEAVEPDGERYTSFNDFFTRQLRADVRPVDPESGSVVSPVDAEVSESGIADEGVLVQAKGRYFTLEELLGDTGLAEIFAGGAYATLYLSPRDYHRIHMPLDGTLERMTHIPGRLFSVNHATTRAVPRLFARNERIVNVFRTPAGPMAVILVGAIFVGSMDTVWSGTVTPAERRISDWRYDGTVPRDVVLSKGDELGRFNMGSTVILLFPRNAVAWSDDLRAGTHLRYGQRIGKLTSSV